MTILGKCECRLPLLDEEYQPVRTLAQATAAREALRVNRRAGNLPGPLRTPGFEEFQKHYLTHLEMTVAKSPLFTMSDAPSEASKNFVSLPVS
jgi:hypothetical protein